METENTNSILINTHRAPAIFIGHGSPTVALDHDAYTESIEKAAESLEDVERILLISAHWLTGASIKVTSGERLDIQHDFSGFPEELYQIQMNLNGDPQFSDQICEHFNERDFFATLDTQHEADHGVWMPLYLLARNPLFDLSQKKIIQISLPQLLPYRELVRMGRVLKRFRSDNCALISSGNLTHNLRNIVWSDKQSLKKTVVTSFDQQIWESIQKNDCEHLMHPEKLTGFHESHPTTEHFLPLYPMLGARDDHDDLKLLHEGIQYQSISMRSFEFQTPSS